MRLPIVLPLLAILTFPVLAQAQRPSRSGLGYMGGPQLATWHSEAAPYHPVPGFVAGIYAPIWAGWHVEIQPELLLSLQGAARDLPDDNRLAMRNLRAIMPVSLKVFLNRSFNLQMGVQGGYLVLAKADGTDISDRLNQLDMGMNVGLGIGSPSGLDLTLRYYTGLSNTLVEDHILFPSNRTLQLTAGYRFLQFARQRRRR